MAQQYNQLRAMLAIAKGSFKAILRNPSAVAFSFGFPLVFILVFGFIGGGPPSIDIALARKGDTAYRVVKGLLRNPMIRLTDENDTAKIRQELIKGRIAAILTDRKSVV